MNLPEQLGAIVVDTTNPTPPYEQIRKQIIELIKTGKLEATERLPSVRQMANDLGLATGTVARSYKELEQQGWVTSRKGAGTRVHKDPPITAAQDEDIKQLVSDFITKARLAGHNKSAITKTLRELWGDSN